MFDQTTSLDMRSAISLQESADGHLQLDLLDGLTTDRSGQAPARASRSLSQENNLAQPMSGIYGPTFFDSSEAVAPPSSWAIRLQQRLGRIGSTECLMTWKASVTPAKRPLLRLAPSTPRIVEIDSGLLLEAKFWPTCVALEARQGFQDRSRGKKGLQESLTTVVVKAALWPTIQAADGNKGHLPPRPHDTGVSLPQRVAQVFGTTPPGSSATTEKPGALAPEFAAWLMGFPPHWLECAPEKIPKKPK